LLRCWNTRAGDRAAEQCYGHEQHCKTRPWRDVKHVIVRGRSIWCWGQSVSGLRSFLVFYCDIRSSIFSQLCLLGVEYCVSCDAQYLVRYFVPDFTWIMFLKGVHCDWTYPQCLLCTFLLHKLCNRVVSFFKVWWFAQLAKNFTAS
jgi:hypothetical protein